MYSPTWIQSLSMNQSVSMILLQLITSTVEHISLSVDMYVYPMAHGGSVGTLILIWKNDQSLLDHDQ